MPELFGTDGVRGIAGRELGCVLAMNLGKAVAMQSGKGGFLVARDTRLSSPMLASAVMSGICSMGSDVTDMGVLPTPALSLFVNRGDYNGGIMISASHNPWEYNGIKIFDSKGRKLSEERENEIERLLFECSFWNESEKCGNILRYSCADREYVTEILRAANTDISDFNIALDCANGAVCSSARLLFDALGCRYTLLFDSPDGRNINKGCGSTDMRALSKYVADNKLDCGIALDGDGDRCLFTDERGNILDGDVIMAICALDMMKRGKLRNKKLVVTVMSNIGLSEFCESVGISCEICDVGDRNVSEKMKETGADLGGEQSGHIIFARHSDHGDGLLTALKLLSAMKRSSLPLSELASALTLYPRVEKTVQVTEEQKSAITENKRVAEATEDARESLGCTGRALVRISGTEPCIRIMVQAKDPFLAERVADELEKKIIECLR